MMAGQHNFSLMQGDTWNTVITWSQDGSAVDLTDYTGLLQVRATPTSDSTVLNLTIANNGLVVATPANGQIQINASASTMAGIEPGVYYYQLQVTSGSGIKTTLLYGSVTITKDVAIAS